WCSDGVYVRQSQMPVFLHPRRFQRSTPVKDVMLAMPGASFRREATKGLPGGSLLQAGDCAIISGAGRKNSFRV
ncbi:hypothetical protein, partial [Escherichia coli]